MHKQYCILCIAILFFWFYFFVNNLLLSCCLFIYLWDNANKSSKFNDGRYLFILLRSYQFADVIYWIQYMNFSYKHDKYTLCLT